MAKSNFGTRSGGVWDSPHSMTRPVVFRISAGRERHGGEGLQLSRLSLGLWEGEGSPEGGGRVSPMVTSPHPLTAHRLESEI